MARMARAIWELVIGLTVDLVCSLLNVLQLTSLFPDWALGIIANTLQVFAMSLMMMGLFCLQPVSRHFVASFRWRVAQFSIYIVLTILAALPMVSTSVNPASQESLAVVVAFTLTSIACSCLLALFANREMLMGSCDALRSVGSHERLQDRTRSTSTLVVVSYSLLVASLLIMTILFAVLDANAGSGNAPLVLAGLLTIVSLVVSVVFVLVVDVLTIVRIHALRTAFAEVVG